ncbi:uncharacterized protein LOC144633246 isoform X1 [Oculina patagonica]
MYVASNARLGYKGNWPWQTLTLVPGEWIQVDLGWITMVTKIATQGSPNEPRWVTDYKVSYSLIGGYFKFYRQPSNNSFDMVFQANIDNNNTVFNTLDPAIVARFIRLHPVKFHGWISLRMELFGCNSGFSIPKPPVCEAELGLESHAIDDKFLTASSSSLLADAGRGRLHLFANFLQDDGGWIADDNDKYGSWFQVEFRSWTKVTRISTQGKQADDEWNMAWVTKYHVTYSYDGIFFNDYEENGKDPKVFDGNTNGYTVVSHKLKIPIITRYIRINPISFHGFQISLRADFYGCQTGFSVPKIPGCRAALGMESGLISNTSITASSQEDSAGPENARLHFKGESGQQGGWMPKWLEDHSYWLQVDFGVETQVTGISTQGLYYSEQWVKSYSLKYSNNGSYFEEYHPVLQNKTFPGNTDQNNVVTHELVPPIRAQYIRVIPESWHNFISLRLEFYGCLAILAESGGYSQWSSWSECSATCGVGLRSQNRSCTNPPPGPYGKDCSHLGSKNQTVVCNSGKDCPYLENKNKTANCSSGENCLFLGNNTQKAECNNSSCAGRSRIRTTAKTRWTALTKSSSNHTITYVSTSLGILVALALITGLLVKYCLLNKKSISSPSEFKYNAFIIYSQEDSQWVGGTLLPLLEEKYHLKCCIHYRDFTPGKPFQECMAESVYNSCKIIAVLSSNFLKSNYCSYELNIAKYRLLNRQDDSLVIIRIDKESECRRLPRELRKRNFIDYSNSLERPQWESRLLRFLNLQNDSSKQDVIAEQTECENTVGDCEVVINNVSSPRSEELINNDTEMDIVMEQETML